MASNFLLDIIGPAGLDIPGGVPDAPPVALGPKLNIIVRAVRRANSLIEDLLDVTRIDAKRLAVDAAMVDGSLSSMKRCWMRIRATQTKPIKVTHAWDGNPSLVVADRGRIFQVFSNLVGNALKFTPKGGAIDVRGRLNGDEALFTIADTGPGIPPENLRISSIASGRREKPAEPGPALDSTSRKELSRRTGDDCGSKASWAPAPRSFSPFRAPPRFSRSS